MAGRSNRLCGRLFRRKGRQGSWLFPEPSGALLGVAAQPSPAVFKAGFKLKDSFERRLVPPGVVEFGAQTPNLVLAV
jgi:hypothetical protein